MKIYRITVNEDPRHPRHVLHTSYQSATQSFAYWERASARHGYEPPAFTSATVAEEEWKPVDKATEEKLNRVAVLWEQLVATDQEGLDALLDDLVKRLAPKPPAAKPVLNPIVRGEAEALLKLDRLVDAG